MNALLQKHGIETLDQITPSNLQPILASTGFVANDITTVELTTKLLKRTLFAGSCGYVAMMVDPKTGERFVKFEGADAFVKINPPSSWAETVAREEAARRAEREAKKALPPVVKHKRTVSNDSGHYPISRNFVEVASQDIVVGDLLLLTFGLGTQLFKVTEATGKLGLKGLRLDHRGTRYAHWRPSWISRNDKRIKGKGFLVPQDPAYPA